MSVSITQTKTQEPLNTEPYFQPDTVRLIRWPLLGPAENWGESLHCTLWPQTENNQLSGFFPYRAHGFPPQMTPREDCDQDWLFR